MTAPDTGPDPYDAPLSAIREHVDNLGAWLAIWVHRDKGSPGPNARACGRSAMDAIDSMRKELMTIAIQLHGEIDEMELNR